ncbi:hypothetical protein AVEN_175815-1 [Araneus ventricosus]|uniref:Uncharacterized protein n=1 Tax=Araneus ventricosus TaxID=182803 RepID=A0A4Y2F281_ARAVE|nr:hypothetical protein AVEN_175815-1 [Araneus ventricosus]
MRTDFPLFTAQGQIDVEFAYRNEIPFRSFGVQGCQYACAWRDKTDSFQRKPFSLLPSRLKWSPRSTASQLAPDKFCPQKTSCYGPNRTPPRYLMHIRQLYRVEVDTRQGFLTDVRTQRDCLAH